MPALFSVTVFVSAALLFLVQPMVAKIVLPRLGGTPAVWNTCMVFFQAVLLVGYAWAHWTAHQGKRSQVAIQAVLVLIPFLVLPFHFPSFSPSSSTSPASPVLLLLALLAIAVGLPFFVLSTTGPLMQKWFSRTDHRYAADPYFLYASSNLGSMLGLLAYPVALEPYLTLRDQARWWADGYRFLALVTIACGMFVWRRGKAITDQADLEKAPSGTSKPALTWRDRGAWVAMAFVPSSLMLGLTTYLTTDIASIPLLWVIPLALYLLSFIVVFSRRQLVSRRVTGRLLAILTVLLALLFAAEDMQPPMPVVMFVHLSAFFVAALFCHGELAQARPGPAHLTEFYLWLAVGGVVGGAFNALVAPMIFASVVEYPLALVLACLLRERIVPASQRWRLTLLDVLLPLALAGFTAALVLLLPSTGITPLQARVGIMFGIPACLCYLMIDRPLRFALGIGGLLLASQLYTGLHGKPISTQRSFFGVLRVTTDTENRFHQLVHGNTIHGRQSLDPNGRKEPTLYYHRTGPVGRVFASLESRWANANIGVIGLGAGAIAAYALPGQTWTFYEIDPLVEQIARDERYFTFLRDCRARKLEVVHGDGRLRLQEAGDAKYDLLILDAFSSDSVPVHLLTQEALRLYLAKLAPGGIMAFHISNRYLDLKPVVDNLAKAAALECRFSDDLEVTTRLKEEGKTPSQWVVLARTIADLGPLSGAMRWQDKPPAHPMAPWTDDFSNILGVFKWEWAAPND
jgi:hypothetical protein